MKQKRSLWRSFAGFFKDTSPFMTKVERVALLAELNLCLLLTSLPLVTVGAGLTALHAALSRFSTLSYGSALRTYFQAFRKALLPTLPLGLLTLAAAGGLSAAWYIVLRSQLTDHFAVMLPLLLSSAVVLFTAGWLYPLCAKALGAEAGLPFKSTLSSALLLGLKELTRSFLALPLLLAPGVLLLWAIPTSLTLVGIWLLFGIAPFALLHASLVKSVIFPEEKL